MKGNRKPRGFPIIPEVTDEDQPVSLTSSIARLGLSKANQLTLRRLGTVTVGQVSELTEQKIRIEGNASYLAYERIRDSLWKAGFTLKGVEQPPRVITADTSLYWTNISGRALNVFRHYNIYTIGKLISHTEQELLSLKGISKRCLDEVKETLAQHGFSLR